MSHWQKYAGLCPAGRSMIFPGRWETIKVAIKGREDENKNGWEKKKSGKLS